jgi:hypothetical protein
VGERGFLLLPAILLAAMAVFAAVTHPTSRTLDKEALVRDLKKIVTVGIGRLPRQKFAVIERVAARLGSPSLAPMGQVEEVVRDAIVAQGRGDYAEAIALLFGAHEDTANEPAAEERREIAAKKLYKSPHTLKTDYEPDMCGHLAAWLLKRYDEAIADQNAQQSKASAPTPAGEPDEDTSQSPDPSGIEADEQPTLQPRPEAVTADDAELREAPPPARPRSRLLALTGLAAVVIAGAIVALLAAGGGSSTAHHHAKTASLAVPVDVAPFSPQRQTYDYDVYDPNDTNCADPNNPAAHFGRCGAETGRVLDSFINTPSYGDERYFFDARLSNAPNNTNTDPLTGVEVGDTVVLRAYVDNDTAVDPSDPEASDTRNTRVRVNLAATSTDELAAHEWVLQPQAFVSASDAQTAEDGVNLVGPEPFALQYEPGSAVLLRGDNTYPLSNEVVGNKGAPVGLLYMNGDLPAGNNFDATALVELRAKVVAVAPPEIRITADVRQTAGKQTSWRPFIEARPGDEVQWLLNTSNGPWSTVYHVTIRDVLPTNLEIVPGSVKFTNARGTVQLASTPSGGPLFGGGYDNGSYNPGDNTLITFNTKALGNFKGCRVIDRNQGFAHSDQTPVEVTNDADVVITKPGCSKSRPAQED